MAQSSEGSFMKSSVELWRMEGMCVSRKEGEGAASTQSDEETPDCLRVESLYQLYTDT